MNNVTEVEGNITIQNVLLSVSDKKYLDFLVSNLLEINPKVQFHSTSGTYNHIKEVLGKAYRSNLIDISEYTGYPEMQGGLVKTLHPKVHMGILAERINTEHDKELIEQDAVRFDLVVVNLYPFADTIAKQDCTFEMARANIDIGGPTMLRGAAKNFHGCAVLCNSDDYSAFISELLGNKGSVSFKTRFELMKKAFNHTSSYDIAIDEYTLNIDYSIVKKEYKIRK